MSQVTIEFNMEKSKTNPLYVRSIFHECRFCLEEGNDLISVCGCKGTTQYVHKECIKEWINRFPPDHPNHNKCQICKQQYNLELIQELETEKERESFRNNSLAFFYVFCIIMGLTIIVILIGML